MHLKSFLLACGLCWIYILRANAQVGYTPEQIHAKYGKSDKVLQIGPNTVQESFNAVRIDILKKYEITHVYITYFKGRCQVIAMARDRGVELFTGGKYLALALIDEHPNNTLIQKDTFMELREYFTYKGYEVQLDNRYINIYPVSGAKLDKEMHQDELMGSNTREQQQASEAARSLR